MVQSGKRTIRRPDEIKSAGHEGLWAVVVGEGRDRRFGSRTRLRETLERIGRVIPPERTLVVRLPGHARDQASQVGEESGPHILDEPDDRGTGAAVLLAALWIEAREPRATVVFLPSDRVIGEEGVLMARVAEMADFVERQPGWMILLGVSPHGSDMEHGWIEPGQRVGWVGPSAVYGIRRFHDRPSVAEGQLASGCLWNTLVWAARPGVVLAAGRECAPSLYEHLVQLPAFWATEHERWALHHAYALAPAVDFSRAILETCSLPLAVLKAS
jgi:mannose-1-phosphate guanylyltransferase